MSKPKPLIGIDISSTSIKLLELQKDGSTFRVESFATAPLPPDSVLEKNIINTENVGDTLRKLIKKSGSSAKYAALAVPTSVAFTKKIQMSANLSEEEMEAQIKEEEAAKYIPSFNSDEMHLDFVVEGAIKGDTPGVNVLLAASRSENVEARMTVAEMAKITPIVMDIESFAVEHSFELLRHEIPNKGNGKLVAIVDVGATMTSINIFESGELIYNREQSFGGKQLTEEIMRRYGMSFEDAEEAKKIGKLPDTDSYTSEVLEPFKEVMAQQINRLLQFFYSTGSYDHVDQLLLGGGCASISNIDDIVAQQLGVPVAIANPFSKVKVAGRVNNKLIRAEAPSLLIATGLALRSFK